MARYYQKPQSPIVDLTPQYPTEFYSRLIDQVQQNRNQASAASAAFMTDIYGQKHLDAVTRDRVMELAKDPLAKALDKDIVTPASMAQAVAQAGKIVSPWKNINAIHVEQAEREQKLRDTWGSNYIGNSVMQQSLMTPEGNLISPDDIKLTAANTEDAGKLFDQYMADWKNHVQNIEGGLQAVPGNPAFLQAITTTYRGMTPDDKKKFMESGEWKRFAGDLVPLMDAVKASGQDPMQWLEKNIDTYTNQLVQQPSTTRQFVNNPDYKAGVGLETVFGNGVSFKSKPASQLGNVETQELLNKAKGNVNKFSLAQGSGRGDEIGLPFLDYRNPEERGGIQQQSLIALTKKYPLIAKQFTGEGERITPSNQAAALGNPSKFLGKLDEAGFLGAIEQISNDPTYFNSVIDYQDPNISAGLQRRLLTTLLNSSNNSATVIDEEGKNHKLKDVMSGVKDTDMEVPQFVNNGQVVVKVKGKQYTVNTVDNNGAGYGIFDKREEPMVQMAAALDKSSFEYFDKPHDLPDVSHVESYIRRPDGTPMTDERGAPVRYTPKYQVMTGLDPNGNYRNYVIKTFMDLNGEPHTINDGKPYQQTMSIGEAQAEMFDFIGESVKQSEKHN